MSGHFFVMPNDLGFHETDVKASLLQEDRANDQGAVEFLRIHQAFDSLALQRQGKFWEHDVMQVDALAACMRPILCP